MTSSASSASSASASVALVGPGSVGLLYAGAVAAAGVHELTICARGGFERLRVESFEPPVDVAVRVLLSPDTVREPFDWILLATKAQQTEGVADWLAAACGPRTRLVVAQNGVEQRARGEALAPPGVTVVPAVTYCSAERIAPGVVRHSSAQPVKLVVPAGPDADALATVFEGTYTAVEAVEDWTTAAWQKLAQNVWGSGICTLTGMRSEVLRRSGMLDRVGDLMDEFAVVASAAGARLPETLKANMVSVAGSLPPGIAPSMLQDRVAGRATEHDAIYGAVLREAARQGIPAPLHAMFWSLLDAISA